MSSKPKAPKQPYPAFYYGPQGARMIVKTQEAFDALGPGWHDSPAKVDDDDTKAAEKSSKK